MCGEEKKNYTADVRAGPFTSHHFVYGLVLWQLTYLKKIQCVLFFLGRGFLILFIPKFRVVVLESK